MNNRTIEMQLFLVLAMYLLNGTKPSRYLSICTGAMFSSSPSFWVNELVVIHERMVS